LLSLLFIDPLGFAIIALGILSAITIHEFAHAWVADKLGDPTPRYQGRVTLDPRSHLDPIGTLAIFIAGFGWGRPVPFDPYNLKDPQRDTALIALAGPVSNLILAGVITLLIHSGVLGAFATIGAILIQLNVMLAVFNLVPVHPLDGSKIIMAFLPQDAAYEYEAFMARYGMVVLLLLIVPWNGTSPVSQLIWPVINTILNLLGVSSYLS
jgi:Zn-dependent protease